MKSTTKKIWRTVASWLRGTSAGTTLSKSTRRPAVIGDALVHAASIAQELDDEAVDQFAAAMKAKLAAARASGRNGWNDKARCDAEWLSDLLYASVSDRSLVDIANYAMMLHQRREALAPATQPRIALQQAIRIIEEKHAAIDRVRTSSADPDQRGYAADFIADADLFLQDCKIIVSRWRVGETSSITKLQQVSAAQAHTLTTLQAIPFGVDVSLLLEVALAELIDKLVPGLDTGDLLGDAVTASKAIDALQIAARVQGTQAGAPAENPPSFSIWWRGHQEHANKRRPGEDWLDLDESDKGRCEMCWDAATAAAGTGGAR